MVSRSTDQWVTTIRWSCCNPNAEKFKSYPGATCIEWRISTESYPFLGLPKFMLNGLSPFSKTEAYFLEIVPPFSNSTIICDLSFIEENFVNLSSNKQHNIHCMKYHKACAKVSDETYEMCFHEEVFDLLCGRFCCARWPIVMYYYNLYGELSMEHAY